MRLYGYIVNREQLFAGNGVYNCRPPRGGTGFSTHAEGRAMDLSAALPNGQPNGAPIPRGSPADRKMRAWAGELIANHVGLGIQRIVYREIHWRCDTGMRTLLPGSALYKMHMNHMHVEQTRGRALSLTLAQIQALLEGEDDDMYSDEDRARDKRIESMLTSWFGTQGDMRKKQDAIYVEVADEADRPPDQDTLGSRVVDIARKLDA
jgi:hypothetical protein